MTQETFNEFWEKWSAEWYNNAIIRKNGTIIPVSELCAIKKNYAKVLCKRYLTIKRIVKDSYFRDKSKRLSRYKRAAVIAYAINGASPLAYYNNDMPNDLDPDFLKQRLAFFIAIGSIVQDYPECDVSNLDKPYFDFDSLGKKDIIDGEDNFLLSVYKDMFFADVYENYNVLTMANVFGLLTERASKLGELKPIEISDK